MKRRAMILFVVFAAAVLAANFLMESSAQQQRRDRFSHASAAHKKLDCASCHKMPTSNWVAARGFPDVAQFPGHAACVNCHRRDFFVGNKPAFCAGCHTSAGPRSAPLFPFPVRTRSHEFATIFPHNVHQDVIASVPRERPPVAVAHFVNASFSRLVDDPPTFNNCAICHEPTKTLPKFEPRLPAGETALVARGAESFAPSAAFFKSMPSGHASCFQCHYQGVKPAAANCAGCHQLTSPYFPSAVVKRYSLKFSHEEVNEKGDKVHTRDCMTCHVRIAANSDLKTLKDADVPLMTCTACHNHAADLKTELDSRADSIAKKTPVFQCSYCHTKDVGSYRVPPSHEKQ
jgi:hypothetical protein